MNTVIPAILPESFDELRKSLARVRGAAPRVQIDVCDGTYAKTKTWPYNGKDTSHFTALQEGSEGLPYWDEFDFEIDLLLQHPDLRLKEWALAGPTCLIVHVETTDAMDAIVEYCSEENANVELAVATLPKSPLGLIEPWLPRISFVQVMGNNTVGEQGRALEEEAIEKVRLIHERFPSLVVGVDIGVTEETLPSLLEAGATRFVAGSAIFSNLEPKSAYHKLVDLAG